MIMGNVMNIEKSTLAIAITFALSGCASITGTSAQNISLQARTADGKELKEAQCELINKRGTYFVTTPGTISISRSNDDLMVTCRKEGYENGRASVVSNTKGSMFGNILFGGGIGAIIDHNNGTAYEYPNFVQVIMGTEVFVGSKKETTQTNANPLQGNSPVITENNSNKSKMTIKLEELKSLKEQGLISQETYDQKQQEVLKDMN